MLAIGMTAGLGQVTPRLIGLFVVPTDYPTIGAAVRAAEDAGGGTVVVLDRPEGAYDESIYIDFYERRDKKLRLLGVGAILNGNISVGCGAQGGEVEISGFQIYGEIEACAQDLGDLIMAVQGLGPDPEKLGGRLILRGNSIEGDVRLKGYFGFNYELVMTDNSITGGVRVEIERVVSLKAQLKNNWVFGSAGEGVRLRLQYDPARPTLQSSAKLEGNVIVAHSSHGLVLEFTSDSKQPTPVELIGNIIEQNGGCGIFVNDLALRLGAQLRGQANSVYLNSLDFCPDPSSKPEAQRLFPSQLFSTKVWRVCPQAGPNCDTTSIQEALNKAQRGDVIVVVPGVYAENLRVSGSRVIVAGRPSSAALASPSEAAQADRVVLQGKEGPGIVVENGVVFLRGFTIQGFKERCVERQGDKCVKADPGDGIRQQGRSQLFLRDVRVLQNEGWGVRARSSSGLRLERVELRQNRDGGLALAENAAAHLRGVQIVENRADGIALFGPAVRLQGFTLVGGNQGCGLAAYPFEPGMDPLALSRGAGRAPHVTDKGISLSANGTDLCGQLPKELRALLAQPAQSSVELSCAQDRLALQKAVDSLQPGGRLRLRGTCPAGAVIDKPVIIEGSGADSTVIPMLSLLAGAEVQLSNLNAAQLRVPPGAKVSAKQSKLAGIWIEGGELTAEGSQLQGPLRVWGLSVPVRLFLKSSSVQGALELWALRQGVEAELTETQLTGSKEEVGIRVVGLGGLGQSQLILQRSRISGYKTGLLVAGASFARLEGNTITGNELGVALSLPGCPPVVTGRLLGRGELTGLDNHSSGNQKDFCPEGLDKLLGSRAARPARFTIETLTLQPAPPVVAGTTVTITAVVRNRGDRQDTKPVWLEVEGKRQSEQNVTLRPGEKLRLSFSYTFSAGGTVTVTVRSPDGAATTSVEAQVQPARLSVCCNVSFQAARGGPSPAPQRFTVSNRGGQPLNWTASVDKSWVRLEPTRGALKPGESTNVTVTVDISGLSKGNQGAKITISSPEATNSPQTLFVGLQITAATIPPDIPTTFTWTEPETKGQIRIEVRVTAQADRRWKWEYIVTNLSYNPPGGNGFSGFNIAFASPVEELSGQFGPSGWVMNCCGRNPPLGAEWDKPDGSGVMPGGSATFGFFTEPREAVVVKGTQPFETSWAHTWVSGSQAFIFTGDLLVPGRLK